MNKPKNQTSLLRPNIAQSKRGGLILIGRDGSRVYIPDSEVEATIAEMETVRAHQLRRECTDIANSVRYTGAV